MLEIPKENKGKSKQTEAATTNPFLKQMENDLRELISCVAKLKRTDDIFLRLEIYKSLYPCFPSSIFRTKKKRNWTVQERGGKPANLRM